MYLRREASNLFFGIKWGCKSCYVILYGSSYRKIDFNQVINEWIFYSSNIAVDPSTLFCSSWLPIQVKFEAAIQYSKSE